MSAFWNYYIAGIVAVSLLALAYLLKSQSVVKVKKGEKVETLGHVWDGDLQEYNNPLPRWWIGLFYLTIVFAIGYLVLYPGFGNYAGTLGWTQEGQYQAEVKAVNAEVKPLYDKYLQKDLAAIAADPEAQKMGQNLFLTYCMQCHGSDARGAKGFPNLTDHDWLYGGTPEKIVETVNNGRQGQMPAFGAAFGEEKVKDVANYVLKLAGRKEGQGPGDYDAIRSVRGKATFDQVCVACHGGDGRGNQALGAPNLTDKVWLYGGTKATIMETITNGRKNYMPAWKEFLGEGKVHLLAGYVYGLSQRGDAVTPSREELHP